MNIDQTKLAAELREMQQRDAERTAQANLEPCRCGAAPRLIDREDGPLIQGAFIQCDACGMSTGIKPTAAEAIACWQPAAATAAQPVQQWLTYEQVKTIWESDNRRRAWALTQPQLDFTRAIEDAVRSSLAATTAAQPVAAHACTATDVVAHEAAIGERQDAATAAQPVAYRYRVPTANGGSAWTFTKPQPELILETQALGVIAAPAAGATGEQA